MLIPEVNQSESAIFHYANNKRDLDLFFTCKHKNNTCLLPTSSFINPLDKIVATPIIMDYSKHGLRYLTASDKTKINFLYLGGLYIKYIGVREVKDFTTFSNKIL